jgi:DNA-binding transcriptional regulator YiaG
MVYPKLHASASTKGNGKRHGCFAKIALRNPDASCYGAAWRFVNRQQGVQHMTIGPKHRLGREIVPEVFGRNLHALRLHMQLNDKRLGALLGVSAGAIRNWESGVLPSEENAQKILAIAEGKADSEWLLTGRGPEPPWMNPDLIKARTRTVEVSNEFTLASSSPPDRDGEHQSRTAQQPDWIKEHEHVAPIAMSVNGGRIVVSADPKHYRLEMGNAGNVTFVRISELGYPIP